MKFRLMWCGAAALSVLFTAGCGGGPPVPGDGTSNVSENTDTGWVKVWDNDDETYKRCDGATLVYADGNGLTSVSNSTECSLG